MNLTGYLKNLVHIYIWEPNYYCFIIWKTCDNGFILESGIEVCENYTVLHCNSENDSTASSCLLE